MSMIKEITEGFGRGDDFYIENFYLFDQAIEFNTLYECYKPLSKRSDLDDILEEVFMLFDRVLFFGQSTYARNDILFTQKSKGRYIYDLSENERDEIQHAKNNMLIAFSMDASDRESITSIIDEIIVRC